MSYERMIPPELNSFSPLKFKDFLPSPPPSPTMGEGERRCTLTLTPALSEAINAYLWHWAISQWLKATGNASRVLGEGEYGLPSPPPSPTMGEGEKGCTLFLTISEAMNAYLWQLGSG